MSFKSEPSAIKRDAPMHLPGPHHRAGTNFCEQIAIYMMHHCLTLQDCPDMNEDPSVLHPQSLQCLLLPCGGSHPVENVSLQIQLIALNNPSKSVPDVQC